MNKDFYVDIVTNHEWMISVMDAHFTTATVSWQDAHSTAAEYCDGGDWFDEERGVNLADLMQEPHEVCNVICLACSVYYSRNN